jgi:hypothetical protein
MIRANRREWRSLRIEPSWHLRSLTDIRTQCVRNHDIDSDSTSKIKTDQAASRSSSVAELCGYGLGYLKSSRSSAALGDRPSTILVNRPQHVACLLLADQSLGASNGYNLIAPKRRAVLFYFRDLPIVNSILARSLL